MTRTVLCFGEALIDMRGETLDGQPRFIPQPGGAPANVAVGVARLGGLSGFAGQVGADVFGDQIFASLSGFGVDTSLLLQEHRANTALALVALDDVGERSFIFYRNATADLLYESQQLPEKAFAKRPIFHICSNTLTEPGILMTTQRLVRRARESGCLVSFDVNYRELLWQDPALAPDQIRALALEAHLVKFSREELFALYGDRGEALIAELVGQGVKLVLVTDGPNALRAWTENGHESIRPPEVQAIDTTAAGDAFVAGLLYQLADRAVSATDFGYWLAQPGNLVNALIFASRCGGIAATRFGAFDALPTASDLQPM